ADFPLKSVLPVVGTAAGAVYFREMTSMKLDEVLDFCRVRPDGKFRLEDHDPNWAGDPARPKSERKEFAEKELSEDVTALAKAQELLYASDTWSILVVLQAMDAA